MSRRLNLGPQAELDIEDAFRWYERERPGLGLRFLNRLDELFDRILDRPFQFPEIEAEVRRGLVSRFPLVCISYPARTRSWSWEFFTFIGIPMHGRIGSGTRVSMGRITSRFSGRRLTAPGF